MARARDSECLPYTRFAPESMTGLTARRQTVMVGIDGGAETGKTVLLRTDS